MNNILFATDLSSESELAHQRAQQLATFLSATLRIVHVPEDGNSPVQPTSATKVRSWAGNDDTHIESVSGNPCEIITSLAQDTDLLVLGQPRRRTAGELFTGTTGERIIRHLTAPVLVVKNKVTETYRRILVAVDLAHRPADILEVAKTLTSASTQCDVVYAYESPQLNMMVEAATYNMAELSQHITERRRDLNKKLRAEMTEAGLKGRAIAIQIEPSPAATIIAFADQIDADLIILGSRRPGIKRLMLGSVATQVLSRAKMDVLIVPPRSSN
ncbi:universal stress protein [Allopusillimonas ginsengisoli]|uniref:universal stress protein n=1 Tax=Allopusillimonas ginsengisoli TaxID=453575 RepID=UPI0014859459